MTESNNGSQKLVYDDSSREPCHWHSNISFARMHPGDKAWDLRRSRILFNASSSNLQALGDRFNIRPGFKEALNKAVEHLYSNTYSYFYSCSATMTANGDSSKLLVLITGANQVSLAARIGESIIADLRAFCRVSATTQPSNWQRQADTSFYSAAEISARPRKPSSNLSMITPSRSRSPISSPFRSTSRPTSPFTLQPGRWNRSMASSIS